MTHGTLIAHVGHQSPSRIVLNLWGELLVHSAKGLHVSIKCFCLSVGIGLYCMQRTWVRYYLTGVQCLMVIWYVKALCLPLKCPDPTLWLPCIFTNFRHVATFCHFQIQVANFHLLFLIFTCRLQVAPGRQTSFASPPSTQTCQSGRDIQNNMMQGDCLEKIVFVLVVVIIAALHLHSQPRSFIFQWKYS